MLPAATARCPSAVSKCAASAVTVLLPFVPVMAMYGTPRRTCSATSSSPTTSTPDSRAAAIAGASGGTNGWYEHAFKALAYNYAVGGWHPLGAEYPETLGIKVALPDRVVVCLTGDGALMMTIQEIATAAANDIPVLCVVCNNGLYGNMRHTQITQFGSRFIGTQLPASNLSNIAREFGAYGERVVKPDEIIPAIGRALASGKPALVEVMIDDSLENLVPPPLSGRSLDKTGAVVDR